MRLANYASMLNLEAIIVGGGLTKVGELYLGSARAEMEARAMRLRWRLVVMVVD